ncbi:hypothetical protein HNP32_003410 [Brevundimonas bullata]|uniref:Uncharacterized protein n=1 Tax=Brevundimonas bullata TaxID=13160 RepID=A0A7W7N5W1_9CAUL|nr:hypothetical protein [Brevundimonas bullata]MBB4799652.1 hypothetical protein [Brevundimonas bullata]MBB6384277.1 hypothetical protein [Brevundimonas bullata]
MTPTELDDALDAMQLAAAGNPDLMPGLITVESNHWVQVLSGVRPTCARLDDGLRHRDIQIHVGSTQETKLLTRAEAGERGAPYRDMAAKV